MVAEPAAADQVGGDVVHLIVGRPWMPGYGISDDPADLLPWAWAVERLSASHDYWVGTVDPVGGPHLAVVWGVWWEDAFWFSTGAGSRKARNLRGDPRCTVATGVAADGLVVTGVAAARAPQSGDEGDAAAAVRRAYVEKYGEGFPEDGGDPLFEVRPRLVVATPEQDFARHPTRWVVVP
jgi:hypothetical protein